MDKLKLETISNKSQINLPESVTFETLPNVTLSLFKEVAELKNLFLNFICTSIPEPDQWFNLEQFCQYHPDKPSKPTVYGWVFASRVPVHKNGKRLRFLKSEIDEWLKSGRNKMNSEIEAEAKHFINRKTGR